MSSRIEKDYLDDNNDNYDNDDGGEVNKAYDGGDE